MTFTGQASGVPEKLFDQRVWMFVFEIRGGPPSLFFCPGILCRVMAPVLDVLLTMCNGCSS